MALLELAKGRLDIESVVLGERAQHVEVVHVTPVPTPNGTLGKGETGVLNDETRVEELFDAESVAFGASARRIVEGEHARFQLADAVTTDGARETCRENQLLDILVVHVGNFGDPVRQFKRGLERFR